MEEEAFLQVLSPILLSVCLAVSAITSSSPSIHR